MSFFYNETKDAPRFVTIFFAGVGMGFTAIAVMFIFIRFFFS